MIRYERFVGDPTPAAIALTEGHVRAHLSAVAAADDDPTTSAEDVQVTVSQSGSGVLILGTLDAQPQVSYHADEFDPYDGVSDGLRAEVLR